MNFLKKFKKEKNPTNVNKKINFSIPSLKTNNKGPEYAVGIDVFNKHINILKLENKNISSANTIRIPFKSKVTDGDFYTKLEEALTKYIEDNNIMQTTEICSVLPNDCVSLDMISLPTINKKLMASSLKVSIESAYKNHKELILNNKVFYTNKQISIYVVTAIKKQLLNNYFQSVSKSKMISRKNTFFANASLCGLLKLNPKLKSHSFIFVDIKQNITHFNFVIKGKIMGFAQLPYGYQIFESGKLVYENMITNHDVAEIVVINSVEKAKSKQLSVLTESDIDKDNTLEETVMTRKTPKKLPKGMQREFEETEEGIMLENFRIFTKWLEIYRNEYDKKVSGKAFEFAIININKEYQNVIKLYNESDYKSDLEYRLLEFDTSVPVDVTDNLDLYGALYMQAYDKSNIF